MGVCIDVKRGIYPVEGAEVIVKWVSGGTSSRWTKSNGIADLEVSAGTAEYLQVNGKTIYTNRWLEGTVEVNL